MTFDRAWEQRREVFKSRSIAPLIINLGKMRGE
jgi:hypothetical protein